MGLIVYYTSVSSSQEIKKQQQRITMVLDSKKYTYELVDISANEAAKQKMRNLMGNPRGLPPQIFSGDSYCGDCVAFDEAVESEELAKFLKL